MQENGKGKTLVAGYIEVSAKKADLERKIAKFKEAGCVEIRPETVEGGMGERPVFDKLVQELPPGSVLVVADNRGLGMALDEIVHTVDNLDKRGIEIVVLSEGVDTRKPSGKAWRKHIKSLAEFDRRVMLEKAQAAIEIARSGGKSIGRPPKLTDEDVRDIIIWGRIRKIDYMAIAKKKQIDKSTVYRTVNTLTDNSRRVAMNMAQDGVFALGGDNEPEVQPRKRTMRPRAA